MGYYGKGEGVWTFIRVAFTTFCDLILCLSLPYHNSFSASSILFELLVKFEDINALGSHVQGWLTLKAQGDDNVNSIVLKFMHDNAPGQAAAYTVEELAERGIHPIFWPAFSPDLNPIEAVWNRMKGYIGRY
ncbi:hypothetical protein EJ02DRAFT_358894 [Clathrospora elynae]|uniref:Tc1-like transposase DDE domain-containing protein n=1 Tax=Clathrospora elynae TaxID=706981 RepID=A0A6A5SAM2_9PLEO|nr:hypothetical protein EJ02DRAFT_358894 [Clathrospora elynae]